MRFPDRARSDVTRLVFAILATCLAFSVWGAEQSDTRRLGELIFLDRDLSADGTISCASCHEPASAFADGRRVAVGVGGQAGQRNAPSLINATAHTTFFWDGRKTSLEEQVLLPLTNSREHGLPTIDRAVSTIRTSARYGEFPEAQQMTADGIARALVAYVRSLDGGESRFDRFIARGDRNALNNEERAGFELFRGPAGCSGCHQVSKDSRSLTDNQFHSVGLAGKSFLNSLADSTRRSVVATPPELDELIAADPDVAALGRFNVTKRPADIGAYRTPSLRNVAETAPYMHDGSVVTLEEAVDIEVYYRSVRDGRPQILTPNERRSIVAFLRSLTTETPNKTQGTP